MTVTDLQLQNSTGKVIALGHREDDYVLESADWGTAKINVKPIYYFPTDDSERMLHAEWEPRPISIIGWVIGKDEAEIESKSQALENFLMVQSETDIIYNRYHLTFLPTAEIKWAITEVDNNEVLRKFQIAGVCIDPIWKNRSVVSVDNAYKTPMFSFPLAFNKDDDKVVFGIHYGQNFIVLNYDGASSGAIMTVQSSGTLSDLVINVQNGARVQTFSIDGTFEPNTTIVIDTREGFNTVTANGVDITDSVFPGSSWIRVLQGVNIFSFYQRGNTEKIPLFHFPLTFNQDAEKIVLSNFFKFPLIFNQDESGVAFGIHGRGQNENGVVFGIHSREDAGQLDVNVTIRQEDLFEVQT